MRKIAVVIGGLAFLGLPALVGAGTITGTAHDFSGKTWNTAGFKCQICHTPHHAGATRLIWNHKLSTQSFTWDETKTAGGTTLPTNINAAAWGGTTKNCLSCHDGTVAVGDLYHGGYGSSESVTGDAVITTGASMAKNHPVSIPYPYNGAANTYNSTSEVAGFDFAAYVAAPTGVRLYNDDGTGKVSVGAVTAKSGIECGSCHNPHNNANDPFLRVSNAANLLCSSCHTY